MAPRTDRPVAGLAEREAGSAVVEFSLISALLITLFLAVIQLGVAMHVRNTLVAAASDGARYGADANRTPADAVRRTRELIGTSLSTSYPAEVTAEYVTTDGVPTVEVQVRASFPVVGFAGPSGGLVVTGHAWAEGRS